MYYNGAGPSSFSQLSHWRAIILGPGDWTPPHDSDPESTDAPPPAASRGRRRPWRRGVPLHLARGRRSELGCRRSVQPGGCVVTWDDHEVSNDYGDKWSERFDDPQMFLMRRAAAYQ